MRGFSSVLLIFVVVILAVGGIGSYYFYNQQKIQSISSFEECAKYFPVLEAYPEQCKTPDGKYFIRELTEEEKQKLALNVEPLPQANDVVGWKTYKDQDISLIYPDGFDVYTNETDFTNAEPDSFSSSEKAKFISFFAPQSDNGFILMLWSNPNNLSVPLWWEDQFKSENKNVFLGQELKADHLQKAPVTIGDYETYRLNTQSQGGHVLFMFKDKIAIFTSTMFEDGNIKVLESLE